MPSGNHPLFTNQGRSCGGIAILYIYIIYIYIVMEQGDF